MIVLRTASGALPHQQQPARVYGYDQRVEAFGERACRGRQPAPHDGRSLGRQRTQGQEPMLHFFIERYREAYDAELDTSSTRREGHQAAGRLRRGARGAAPCRCGL